MEWRSNIIMKWMLCYLTISDNIKYVTDQITNPVFMSYKKFIHFIVPFIINDRGHFMDKINRFDTLLLNCENGEWEVIRPQDMDQDLSFDNLIKLNPDLGFKRNKKEEEEKKLTKTESILYYGKNQLDKLFRRHVKNDRKY